MYILLKYIAVGFFLKRKLSLLKVSIREYWLFSFFSQKFMFWMFFLACFLLDARNAFMVNYANEQKSIRNQKSKSINSALYGI